MKNFTMSLIAFSLFASTFTVAEIREIPPEEMTEAYIRDTTVIVRKQKPTDEQSNEANAVIRVSPLEQDFSEGEATASTTQNNEYSPLPEQQYLGEHHTMELLNQVAYSFRAPQADENKEVRDNALRAALNLQPGEAIDYDNLRFPSQIPDGVIPPLGTDVSTSPSQFVLSIPNTGNYTPKNYVTPGGEYQIDITPDRINFTINAPQ
ncbi:hypothetical protein [Bacterioplanoides sp.]|uniref:hypothetical protein n=1 Tax=Bacterioplanoides sp. TaxID=2066072 RepID=UPI003B5C91E9